MPEPTASTDQLWPLHVNPECAVGHAFRHLGPAVEAVVHLLPDLTATAFRGHDWVVH